MYRENGCAHMFCKGVKLTLWRINFLLIYIMKYEYVQEIFDRFAKFTLTYNTYMIK